MRLLTTLEQSRSRPVARRAHIPASAQKLAHVLYSLVRTTKKKGCGHVHPCWRLLHRRSTAALVWIHITLTFTTLSKNSFVTWNYEPFSKNSFQKLPLEQQRGRSAEDDGPTLRRENTTPSGRRTGKARQVGWGSATEKTKSRRHVGDVELPMRSCRTKRTARRNKVTQIKLFVQNGWGKDIRGYMCLFLVAVEEHCRVFIRSFGQTALHLQISVMTLLSHLFRCWWSTSIIACEIIFVFKRVTHWSLDSSPVASIVKKKKHKTRAVNTTSFTSIVEDHLRTQDWHYEIWTDT